MKIAFLNLLLLLAMNSQAQSNDYIIKQSGDTIRGKITLKNNVFRVGTNPWVEIDARDVIKVKSEYYKGTVVVPCRLILYTDNIDDYQIDYYKRDAIDTVMILQEVYTTPKMNLYYGISDFKVPYYFYKTPGDSLPVQLVIRYYLEGGLANYINDRHKYMGQKSKLGIVEDKGYVNQLYAIMGNCKKIQSNVWELLSYREYSFKEVIRKYNKCK